MEILVTEFRWNATSIYEYIILVVYLFIIKKGWVINRVKIVS